MPTLEGDPDLFGWNDDSGTFHSLNADVVLEATDTREATLTEHPVEGGSVISDHVIQVPDKITLSIAQTQTPLESTDGFTWKPLTVSFAPPRRVGLATVAVGALTDLAGLTKPEDSETVTSLQAKAPVDRVADIHDTLIRIKLKSFPVTITFKGRTYPKFIVTGVKLTHAKGEFGLGRFEITAGEFRTVTTATTKLPDPKDLRAKPAKGQGKKGSGEEHPDKAGLRSSLRSLVKTFGGS